MNKKVISVYKSLLRAYPQLAFPIYAEYTYNFTDHKNELHIIHHLCKKEKISIDIGANIGLHSYFMQKHSKKCFSFEPQEKLYQHLIKIFPKTQVFCYALSSKEGTAMLYVPQISGIEDHESATIESSNLVESNTIFFENEIRLKTLDSYCFNDVGFIKIDCEGHEMEVIIGGINTIEKNLPNLMIEIEEKHKRGNLLAIYEVLANFNYNIFYYSKNSLHKLNFNQIKILASQDNTINGCFINNFIFKCGK